MTKYYRFISQEEFKNLQKDKVVINKDKGKPLFFLKEKPTVYILPDFLNYKITIEELIQSNYPKFENFDKELFQSYMIGTTPTDYLIEIDINYEPSMYNLGWYYMDEENEICIIENCFYQYTINDVTNIYKGDFYDWQHIQTVQLNQVAS
jgi:hypothetical protein